MAILRKSHFVVLLPVASYVALVVFSWSETFVRLGFGPARMWRPTANVTENNDHQHLLTAHEMQQVLYFGQVEGPEEGMDAKRKYNRRNSSVIRSRLTRPDPLKPIRLGDNYVNHTIKQFSQVGLLSEIKLHNNDHLILLFSVSRAVCGR